MGDNQARQDFPQFITADSIKGLGQVYESCILTHVLFSAFLLYLSQHEHNVYGPSVGPESTLTFLRVFLCYRLVCFGIMDPHSRAPKKNTSHGNEVLPQDTTHLMQRPRYQQESPCQYPTVNRTTRRSHDHHKEPQTAVVLSCLLSIRSGQNHLARHSERGKKTRQTEEEVGRQHQEMDRPGVRQVPEGSGQQGKMEETGCEVICGATMTLAVKG